MKRCLMSDAREVRGLQVYPHVPATTHRTTCGVSTVAAHMTLVGHGTRLLVAHSSRGQQAVELRIRP
jgi:hypothetical protein